jgi:pimeloyl-ACP methyl ester carboxylesterase
MEALSAWESIAAVAAILLMALVASSLLGCVTAFVYSFIISPRLLFHRRPETAPFAGRPIPPQAFTSMLPELWTVMLFVGLYPLGRLARKYNATPRQKQPPVILIHGYGVSTMSWYWFMRMLARRGVARPMYALEYDWVASVEKSSQRLAQLVEHVLAEQDATEVDLVAHSWGGFVARWYVERGNGNPRVRRLIMISTPLQGTQTVFFAMGGPRRQMRIGGPCVRSLATAPPTPPYATLWTECDEIATPPEFCLLADVDGNPAFSRRFRGIAHLTMQRHPAVADVVAALLEKPAAWRGGDEEGTVTRSVASLRQQTS